MLIKAKIFSLLPSFIDENCRHIIFFCRNHFTFLTSYNTDSKSRDCPRVKSSRNVVYVVRRRESEQKRVVINYAVIWYVVWWSTSYIIEMQYRFLWRGVVVHHHTTTIVYLYVVKCCPAPLYNTNMKAYLAEVSIFIISRCNRKHHDMQIWRSKEGSKHNLNAVAFCVTFLGATWRFMLNKFRSLPLPRQGFIWDLDVIK